MIHWTDTIPSDWRRTHRWTGRIVNRLTAWVGNLYLWHERAAERRHLLTLDDRMLRDIGISRADAANEARKPFWRK